jgi:DNA-binding transcriptional LysR family regulator
MPAGETPENRPRLSIKKPNCFNDSDKVYLCTMDLDQLETLIAIAEEGSFSAAARRRHLSQPAVSWQLKALEERVGARLIHRRARGARLTAAGEVFLAHARRARQAIQSGQAEVAEIQGVRRGSLRLGATDAATTEILSAAFLDFHRRHPGVEVAVTIDATAALIHGLRQAQFDLVLGTLPIQEPDLTAEPLWQERLYLVLPKDVQDRSLPDTLARQPFIAYPRGSTTRSLIDNAFTRLQLAPRPVMEIGRPAIMAQLVASGLGVSVLPESVIRPWVQEGAIRRASPSRFQVQRSLGLLSSRSQYLDPAARAMRDVLRSKRSST